MTEKLYDDALLKRFDRLTMQLSGNKVERISARLEIPKFIAEYGKECCDQMFEVLQSRDAKKKRK